MFLKLRNSSTIVYLRETNSKNFKIFRPLQKRTEIGKDKRDVMWRRYLRKEIISQAWTKIG
jgi:hypothetical protein